MKPTDAETIKTLDREISRLNMEIAKLEDINHILKNQNAKFYAALSDLGNLRSIEKELCLLHGILLVHRICDTCGQKKEECKCK